MAVTQDTIAAAGLDPFSARLAGLERERETVDQRGQALDTQKGALADEGTRLIKARGEALQPARARLQETLSNQPSTQTNEEQIPQYQRPTMKPEELQQSFAMLMGAAMLVGAGSRSPFYATAQAMTGALNGFVAADHAAVKESLAIFDKNLQTIKERNAQLRRGTEDAYKTWQRDFQAGKQAYELTAAEFDDPIALNLAREGKVDAARKQLDTRLNAIDRMEGQLTTQRAQIEQKQRHDAEMMEMRRMTLAARGATGGGAGGAAGGGATAGGKENTGGLSADYQNDPEYRKQVDYWAQYVYNGNQLPPRFAQSGAGKKMFSDIVSRVPQLGAGDPKEVQANAMEIVGQKSQSRALGTRAAAIEQAASEAREMSSIVLDTSEKFKRTGYQPINKVWAAYEKNTGSPEIRQFGAALNSYINAYARAVNPTGVATVSDKEHARDVLSTADTHEQVQAIIKVLDREMTAAQHSPQNVKKALREEITGRRSTDAPAAGDLKSKVEAAGIAYEPEQYEYRVTPDGKVQRRRK